MPKTKIWEADLYDTYHSFVAEYGKELLSLLNPQPRELILDLGCGTGDITNSIAQLSANVIGLDSSTTMIERAIEKFPKIDFRCMDIYDMTFDNQFDSIFSNATLHWLLNPELAIQKMFDALKPKGKLVVEFGGHGNVKNIQASLQNTLYNFGHTANSKLKVWYFPTISEYTTLLENNGFAVSMAILYDRTTILEGEEGMNNWIKQFASGYFDKLLTNQVERVMETMIDNKFSKLRSTNRIDGVWIADYVRLRIVATKK